MSASSGRHDRAFRIDGWRVEPLRLKLVDAAGQELPLSQRAMSVLVELACAEGAVVRKYDLMSAVWGLAEVSDGALTQAIFELREVFGDDPKHPRTIETIRGVGFRLIPGVNAEPPPAEPVMSRRTWPIWGAVTVLFLVAATSLGAVVARLTLPHAPAAMASLAVLPLTNNDPREVDDRLVERLHEEMHAQTAGIPGIRTIALNSVRKYSGTDQDPRQIARELGVTTLLQGEVSVAGAQILVDLRLVDQPAGRTLWAGQIAREPEVGGVLAICADTTRAVARALHSQWSDKDRDRALALPSQNLAALEAWFKARLLLVDQADPMQLQEVQALLERAIELDPGFALAHVQLATLFFFQTWFQNLPSAEQARKIEPLVRRALELDARLPLAHILIADFEESEEAAAARYRKAIELAPNSADIHVQVANYELWTRGDSASAVRHLALATQIDPLNEDLKCGFAAALGVQGRFDEALALLQAVIESQPQNLSAHQTLGNLLGDFGRWDEGIRHLRQAFALDPFEPHTARHIGRSYDMLGDSAAAAQWYERAITLSGEGSGVTFLLHGLAARARGEEAAALAAFARVKEPSPWPLFVATHHLAMADLRSGRTESAWQRYATAFPELLGPDPPLSFLNVHPAVMLVWLAAATDRPDQVRMLSQRTLALFRSMPSGARGTALYPVLMRLTLGEPEAAIAALQAQVDAGEYRDLLEPVLFQAIADEPEFKRLRSVLDSRRELQLANVARMEREGLLAPIPEPKLAQAKPLETP